MDAWVNLLNTNMAIDFKNIEYLKQGNPKQRQVYEVLTEFSILKILYDYNPIIVGTIPINIDIDSSDVDIICHTKDLVHFKKLIEKEFGHNKNFTLKEKPELEPIAIVATFCIGKFTIEIFGQDTPTTKQNAYRHMVIEYNLLQKLGEAFREKIVELKRQGYKTEPAFGVALGLKGDPYVELLKYEIDLLNDLKLKHLLRSNLCPSVL